MLGHTQSTPLTTAPLPLQTTVSLTPLTSATLSSCPTMDPSATTSKVNYHMDSAPVMVGVTFQIHTQSREVTLSTSLSLPHETTTNGTHVGLVQYRSSEQNQTEFYATFKHGPTNGTVRALIAAMPIYMNGEYSSSIWGGGGAGEVEGQGRGGGKGRGGAGEGEGKGKGGTREGKGREGEGQVRGGGGEGEGQGRGSAEVMT